MCTTEVLTCNENRKSEFNERLIYNCVCYYRHLIHNSILDVPVTSYGPSKLALTTGLIHTVQATLPSHDYMTIYGTPLFMHKTFTTTHE